ncbi:MAG: peptide-methionine (S)-S-oxide reductase MsrA [Ferruginibacter sp.]|nr:peptide-methionine (S)-S-oxide reductase MsrA [Ferruginibacter sp.]
MKIILLSLTTLFSLFSCAEKKTTSTINNVTDSLSNYTGKKDTATFGTGCFWCTEAIFQQLNGVLKVTSGYSGGQAINPSYKEVCSGTTGHAECLNIIYDPAVITFDELLEAFWQSHDPTTLNRQGNDVGTQYRSVVFYHNEEQKSKTEKYKIELSRSGAWTNPVVTALEPFVKFYPAEDYHQNYYNNNKGEGYCQFVIAPKLEKFEKVFKNKLRKQTH